MLIFENEGNDPSLEKDVESLKYKFGALEEVVLKAMKESTEEDYDRKAVKEKLHEMQNDLISIERDIDHYEKSTSDRFKFCVTFDIILTVMTAGIYFMLFWG